MTVRFQPGFFMYIRPIWKYGSTICEPYGLVCKIIEGENAYSGNTGTNCLSCFSGPLLVSVVDP
jgi:hypothetical protein